LRQRQQPSEAWTGQGSTSKRYEISKSLTGLSIRRQADVSDETYAVYVEDLLRFQIDDVEAACIGGAAASRRVGGQRVPGMHLLAGASV
jgi:hypothetical protein